MYEQRKQKCDRFFDSKGRLIGEVYKLKQKRAEGRDGDHVAYNKGSEFERMLDISNEMYSNKGIAKIIKRPTPVKVLKTSKGRILRAAYEKKSTVDYDGVYHAKSIQFEAKSILDIERLELRRIEQHQYDHLVECSYNGAVCFLIVFFAEQNKIYVYPLERLKQAYRAAEEGGRKSIPLSEFEQHGYEVKAGRVPVDYLVAVDAMLIKYA